MRFSTPHASPRAESDLLALYQNVRGASRRLAAPLTDADATVQSMPDASPAKWHLAHTTWFFETMVLAAATARTTAPSIGISTSSSIPITRRSAHVSRARGAACSPVPRSRSVRLSRACRRRDRRAARARAPRRDVAELIELGCHHEQQHQELLLTDILHLFAQNPLRPAYKAPGPVAVGPNDAVRRRAIRPLPGGVVEIGHDGAGFAFDSEGPRHRASARAFRLADRLVTNAEWMAFIADGGYRNPLLWLSDGWAKVQRRGLDGAALLGGAGRRDMDHDAARRAAGRPRMRR